MTQKGEMVERLQVKASSIGRILTNLEKKYSNTRAEDMKKSPSGSSIGGHPPNKRAYLKIQPIPPFNATRIKNSPSMDPATPGSTTSEEADEKLKTMIEEIDREDRQNEE